MADDRRERMEDAQRRALSSLGSLLGGDEHEVSPTPTEPTPPAAEPVDEEWVTVGEAAEQSGLTTAAIRQLYRSGAIRSRRRDGASGPYLVPIEDVMAQVEPGPDDELDAAYWEGEAKRARAEAAALRAELGRVRVERDTLRTEVAELRARSNERPLPRPSPIAQLASLAPDSADDAEEPDTEPEPHIDLVRDSAPPPTWEPPPLPPPTTAAPSPSAEDTVVPDDGPARRGFFRRR